MKASVHQQQKKLDLPVAVGLEQHQVTQGGNNEAETCACQGANQGDEQAKAGYRDGCHGYQQHKACPDGCKDEAL